jgi:hypothetical protein
MGDSNCAICLCKKGKSATFSTILNPLVATLHTRMHIFERLDASAQAHGIAQEQWFWPAI